MHEATQTITLLSAIPAFSSDWCQAWLGSNPKRVRSRIGQLVRRIRKTERLGGPLSVQRNLVHGLRRAGYPFMVNPPVHKVTRLVGVLSNVDALKWAIKAKRQGRIDILVAGPNVVSVPEEEGGVIEQSEIDTFLVPSRWAYDGWIAQSEKLRGRIAIWPAGVDTEFFKFTSRKKTTLKCLIYEKAPHGNLRSFVESELTRRGIPFIILRYGFFAPLEYKDALEECSFMIYLRRIETQGLALHEAWSCDIPTLIWDPGYEIYQDLFIKGELNAPYMVENCGLRFKGVEDFPDVLTKFLEKVAKGSFAPRVTQLEHFTPEKTAQMYAEIFTCSRRKAVFTTARDFSHITYMRKGTRDLYSGGRQRV